MIPYLQSSSKSPVLSAGIYERLVEAGFEGDLEAGATSRTVFATDNSIYQVEPQGILFPKNAEDLKIIANVLSEPLFADIIVAPRGGGTGTNGQSLTPGIVVDCSRHMNQILEIDPIRRIARVQAGVVKDQLNRALVPYGLFFAPELSTSNRATIGGMVSTDACGQGSCLYGKTSNHVLGLRVILTDGSDWWSRPMDELSLSRVMKRKDRIGAIYRVVERIERDKREQITEVFPKLNRYMTGYNLAHIRRPDGQFDLNAILCGSEGTLAIIAEIELNLLPLPAYGAVINVRYRDFNAALEDARLLVGLDVASVETIDEKVLGLAKKDIIWGSIAHFFPDDQAQMANGINIAEILADDEPDLERKIIAFTRALELEPDGNRLGLTIARNHRDVEAIWTMRKRAVGLLGSIEGPVRPVAFVEDTAVPPENLAAYIREFRALLDDAGLSYGMFGHVDAGVLHVRPALDLARHEDLPKIREISDAVVALTKKYGGVLWGEHGKGVRSEYVPEFFGDLYPCLQEIKHSFDPGNRLNPGKIAGPKSDSLLKIDEVPLRGSIDRIIGNDVRAGFDNATYCNGNGACFDFDETSPMCPSYKATRDRRYSPKGRASLLREWLHRLRDQGVDPLLEARALRRANSWTSYPRRIWNTWNPGNRNDFSHEVRQALNNCLACKACVGQCPVKVSVPAFRSKFLELYYGRYLRPLNNLAVGAIETTLPVLARIGPIYNLVVGTRLGEIFMRMVGLTALPHMPRRSLYAESRRLGVKIATLERIANLSAEERERSVVFVPDAFTAHFEPSVGLAAIRLARKTGFVPYLAVPHATGKPLHVHGYLGRFERTATKTARYLEGLSEAGVTLVGVDPSMALVFRSEYSGILEMNGRRPVLLPQEWLEEALASHPLTIDAADKAEYSLLPHCTERSNLPASGGQWKSVFRMLGLDLNVENVGCCGMAGTFGHEVRNRGLSERLYAMSWAEHIGSPSTNKIVMATGYSCRSQVKSVDQKSIPHPLEVIEKVVG